MKRFLAVPRWAMRWPDWSLHIGISMLITLASGMVIEPLVAAWFVMACTTAEEIRQNFDPTRQFSVRDLVANALGCAIGYAALVVAS